jgi:tRNA(fMet)-specific endonuclease VapC
MFVLDTDILTLLFAGHPQVLRRRATVPSAEIAITVVSYIQSMQGRFQFILKAATGEELLRAQSLLDRTIRALVQVETVLPLNVPASAKFDRLRERKKLKAIGRADLLIAAVVMANNATLVTRNLKDFRQVPGLKLENWAD